LDALVEDLNVLAVRGYVGVRAAGGIVQPGVRVTEEVKIAADGVVLPVGPREVVGKAAGGEVCSRFRDSDGRAYARDAEKAKISTRKDAAITRTY
jgi:hypothetical protein